MNTLLLTSALGLFCLGAEILNLRKLIIPALVLGLAAILFVNFGYWNYNGFTGVSGLDMSHMVKIDNFSVAFSSLAIVVTLFILLLSHDYYEYEQHHLSDYMAIIIFTLCGAIILFSFYNLSMLFLGIEILSISLYIMAGSRRFDTRSNEAGFKYFLMGSFASGFLLFGIALIYGATGSFVISDIAYYVNMGNISPLFYIGMTLMIFAMLFKVAAVPFHFWSPDVYEGAPALVTAFMSTLAKVAAFAAFYRLVSLAFINTIPYAEPMLMVVTIATMLLGNLTALNQINFKRLLAYSGISHAGYMLLAIMSIKNSSASALFYYSGAYALATLAAFAVAIPVFSAMKNENINAFDGLAKKQPLLAALLTMAMLSLAGIPPFAGFSGKYYIFSEAIKNHLGTLTIIAVINSIIGVYYYFKVILAMYVQPANETKIDTPILYWAVAIVCILLSLVLGIYPGALMGLL